METLSTVVNVTTPVVIETTNVNSRATERHRAAVRAELDRQRTTPEPPPIYRMETSLPSGRKIITFADDAPAPNADALAELHRERVRDAQLFAGLPRAQRLDPWVRAINCERLPGSGRMVRVDGTNVGLRTHKSDPEARLLGKIAKCEEALEVCDTFAGAQWADENRSIVERALERHRAALKLERRRAQNREAQARHRAGTTKSAPDRTTEDARARAEALTTLGIPFHRGTMTDPIGTRKAA